VQGKMALKEQSSAVLDQDAISYGEWEINLLDILIVLGLNSSDNDLSRIPMVTLENGDRFVVPHLPATVNVIGTVFSGNSFVYRPDHAVKFYLDQAGGGMRDATAVGCLLCEPTVRLEVGNGSAGLPGALNLSR